MSNGDFITSLYPYASRVSSMTGLDPRLILAQAALETGWGRSAPGQNYFGIKGGGGDGLLTTEYVNGRPVQVREPFRRYESPEQSFLDYANLMMRPRYEGVRGAGSLEAQAEALQAAGYATDPEYAAKLIQIASNIPQSGGRAVADRAMVMLGRTQPRQAGAVNMDNLLGFSPVNDQPAMRPAVQPAPQGGGLGSFFRDPAMLENLALAFNTMRLTPDPALAQLIQGRQERRETKATRNRTVEFLRQRGRNDLADAVESGAIDAKTAASQIFAAPETTALQKNYEFLRAQGLSQEDALSALRAGTTVNIPGAPTVGPIPAEHVLIQDPTTGAYRLELLPGGRGAAEAAAAAERKGVQAERAVTAGNIVIQDIGRIQQILAESNLPVTGLTGTLLQNVPGTNAYNVRALTDTIRANIGFERLEQMRQASPTGGALGQVTERELAFLQSVLGSLDQGQSQEQFERNLRRLNDEYTKIIRKFAAYPNAAEFGISPIGEEMPDFSRMSDEELDAYIAGQGGNR